MDQITRDGLLIVSAIAVCVCFVVLFRSSQARSRRRVSYFSRCHRLFESPSSTLDPTGFERLSGFHKGYLFDVRVLPDTLSYRKLPTLWLIVTLQAPVRVESTLDVMMRPTGVETFSNFGTLATQLALPENFPPYSALRTDREDGILPTGLIAPLVAKLDPDYLKEIIISPAGLRIVWLAEEARRSAYLLFRDSELGREPLPFEGLHDLLGHLLTLKADLDSTALDGKDFSI
ncbi:MAG: hypothetical protein EBU34_07550 [Alphaproteobacteria bacterium]|jgi:hypothetical protein|nr:hypothetical protein [Alphaproteobacteria bacterium]